MMKGAIALLVGCSLLGLACTFEARDRPDSAAPDTGPAMGTPGGKCYPNNTCNAGLRCIGGTCRLADMSAAEIGLKDAGEDDKSVSDKTPPPDSAVPDQAPSSDLLKPDQAPPPDLPKPDQPQPKCGDGKVNGTDKCDGTDLGGKTCTGLGFTGGNLACKKDCTHDTQRCYKTSVTGILPCKHTWTAAKSPYGVVGNLLVNKGCELKVQAGVRVIFTGKYYLQVEGTLIARGTTGNKIVFTSGKAKPAPGDWSGIVFKSNVSGRQVGHQLQLHQRQHHRVRHRGICRAGDRLRRDFAVRLQQPDPYELQQETGEKRKRIWRRRRPLRHLCDQEQYHRWELRQWIGLRRRRLYQEWPCHQQRHHQQHCL